MATTISDIQTRALEGPIIKEKDFDLRFAAKVRELTKAQEIVFDPEQVIPDDRTADAIFKAAVRLLADVGLFHSDTSRLIQFSREEIIARVSQEPRQVTLGANKEAVIVKRRACDDKKPPVIILKPSGPLTEELFVPIVQSYAQEETAQGIQASALISAGGIRNKLGAPAESLCLIAEALWMREVARRVGKPDMYIGLPASGISPAAVFTAFFPEGYTSSNAQIPIHLFPELKLNWDRLVLATYAQQHGIEPWTSYVPIMGGYCRGPEETAVAWIAGILGQLMYGRGATATGRTVNFQGISTNRKALWVQAAASLAAERNMNVAWGADMVGPSAGPCTEMVFYEIAALCLAYVPCGVEWVWGTGCRRGGATNWNTGMEGRILGETTRAVSGMSREQANELIKKLLTKYEDCLASDSAPIGKSFLECYDLKTLKPSREYTDLCSRVKMELRDMGIRYDV